jgi:hypothetical protein
LGFKIIASDIKVSNGGLINLSYKAVDLGFGVYDKATDKMTVNVPISIAAKYI